MHMKNLVIVFILALASMVLAQERLNIAVVDLDPQGVPDSENKIISDRLRSDLFNTNKFHILEREKMEEILDEQGFQSTGCTSTECAVEIGKIVGVNRIVAGSIGKIGSLYTLNIRLIDVETGRVEKTAIEDCQCTIETVLVQAINRVARKLAGEEVEDIPTQNTVVTPAPKPTVTPEPETTQKTATTYTPAKRKSKYHATIGYSFGKAEYDIGADIFNNQAYPYDFKPTLTNNMEFSFGGQLPLNLLLSGFLRIHKFDEEVGSTTYSGTLFIVGPRLQTYWKWFYLGYSYGFVKLRFDENSENLIFDSDETDYDKTVGMFSMGVDFPLFQSLHLTADFSGFKNYKSTLYGVLLYLN